MSKEITEVEERMDARYVRVDMCEQMHKANKEQGEKLVSKVDVINGHIADIRVDLEKRKGT